LTFYYKGSEAVVQQFWRQTYGLDIGGIWKYPIPRAKYWGQRPSLVLVLYHVLLHLPNCSLGLFNYYFYVFCELIYYFQSRRVLPRFKAYMESLSSIKQKQSLLSGSVYIVVILEFCHWQ